MRRGVAKTERKSIEKVMSDTTNTDLCDWFAYPKLHSDLEKLLSEKTITGEYDTWCQKEGEIQSIYIDYVQCVKLSDIEIKPIWSPERAKKIREWASEDTLRLLKFYKDDKGDEIIDSSSLPSISREVKLGEETQAKYEIGNGIHRINVAKEMGFDCILCKVSEVIRIKKSDIEQYQELK